MEIVEEEDRRSTPGRDPVDAMEVELRCALDAGGRARPPAGSVKKIDPSERTARSFGLLSSLPS